MPKVIENFILEEKIGKGQFGCVYRGVNQKTGQVVAAKAILRQTIKGKLYELLENEIQVLKTCDNPFIIKLYDFKKTPNNYYLMLEYCNQGDMNMRLEAHRMHIPEQECIRFFCQILKGF